MSLKSSAYLPVEVVFSPAWWHKRHGLRFDRGFFYDPVRRVGDEQRMRSILAATFGDLGMGEQDSPPRPVIGPVNLAGGYLVAEALGCEVRYHDDAPPDIIPRNLSDEEFETWRPPPLFSTAPGVEFRAMVEALHAQFGYVEGDVNWSGLQNTALDLRGQALYTDYYDRPEAVSRFMFALADFLLELVQYVDAVSGSSSISVNRSVMHVDRRLHLASNCTVSMISSEFYERFLLEPERQLADRLRPYGIHHCGENLQRFACLYARTGAEFFDVGWGSDVRQCRELLPEAFFNLRLSPARLAKCPPEEISADVRRLAAASGRLDWSGFCCINLDDTVADENVRALFAAVGELRSEGTHYSRT